MLVCLLLDLCEDARLGITHDGPLDPVPELAQPHEHRLGFVDRRELKVDQHVIRLVSCTENLMPAHAGRPAANRIAIKGKLPAFKIGDRVLNAENMHGRDIECVPRASGRSSGRVGHDRPQMAPVTR